MEQGIDPTTGLQQRLRRGIGSGLVLTPNEDLSLKGVDLEGTNLSSGQDTGDIQDIRAANQGAWSALGNSIGQLITGTVGDIVSTPSYVSAMWKDKEEIDEGVLGLFHNTGEWIKEFGQDEFPIFQSRETQSAVFDPMNSEFWANSIAQFGPTVAMMGVALVTAGSASPAIIRSLGRTGLLADDLVRAQKLVSAGKSAQLTEAMKTSIQGFNAGVAAVASRSVEAGMESIEAYHGTLDALRKENPDTDLEELKVKAEEAATKTWRANALLVGADYLQFSALAKGFSKLIGKDNLGGVGAALAGTAFQAGGEAAEEAYQFIAAEENKEGALGSDDTFIERLGEYLDDPELAKVAVQGALGGTVFQALGNLGAAKKALHSAITKNKLTKNLLADKTKTEEEKTSEVITEQVSSGNAEVAIKHLEAVQEEAQDPVEKSRLGDLIEQIKEEDNRQKIINESDIDPSIKKEYLNNQREVDTTTKNINNLNSRKDTLSNSIGNNANHTINRKIANKLKNKYPKLASKYSENIPEDFKAEALPNTTEVNELNSLVNKIVKQEIKRDISNNNINTLKTKKGAEEFKKKEQIKIDKVLNDRTNNIYELAASGKIQEAEKLAEDIRNETDSDRVHKNVEKGIKLGFNEFVTSTSPVKPFGEKPTEQELKDFENNKKEVLKHILDKNLDFKNEFYKQLGDTSLDTKPMSDIIVAYKETIESLKKEPVNAEAKPDVPTPSEEENKDNTVGEEPSVVYKDNAARLVAVRVRTTGSGLEFIGLVPFQVTEEADVSKDILDNIDMTYVSTKWSNVLVKTSNGTRKTLLSEIDKDVNEKVDRALYKGEITEVELRINDVYIGRGFNENGRIDLVAVVNGEDLVVGVLPVSAKFQSLRDRVASGERITVKVKPNKSYIKYTEQYTDISEFDGYIGINVKEDYLAPYDKVSVPIGKTKPGHAYYLATKADGTTYPVKLHIKNVSGMDNDFKSKLKSAILDVINLATSDNKDTRAEAHAKVAFYVKPQGNGIIRPIIEDKKVVGYGFWEKELGFSFVSNSIDPDTAANEILEALGKQMVNINPDLLNTKQASGLKLKTYRDLVKDRLITNLSKDIVYDVGVEIVQEEAPVPHNMLSETMLNSIKPPVAPVTVSSKKKSNRKRPKASTDKVSLSNLDRTEQVKWFKKNFPNIPISILPSVQHLTSIEGAIGLFKDAAVYIADHASIGTTYHEAFHVLFNLTLTDNQRDILYKEVKDNYGDLSNLELEEKLAEDFQTYKNLRDQNKPTSYLGKISKSILDFFGNMYNMILHRNTIKDIFHRLDTGFKVKPSFSRNVELASTYATYDHFGSPRTTEMAIVNATQLVERVIDSVYFDIINSENTLFGLGLVDELSSDSKIWSKLLTPGESDLFNSIIKEYNKIDNNNPLINKIKDALQNDKVFKEMLLDNISRVYGVSIVKNEEAYDIEDGKNMLASYEFDKMRVNPKSDLSLQARAVFAKIPITYKVPNSFEHEGNYYDNVTGVQLFEDPTVVYNQFMEKASGALTYQHMWDKMDASNVPALDWILDHYPSDDKFLSELFIIAQRGPQIAKMLEIIDRNGKLEYKFINVNRNNIVNRLSNNTISFLTNNKLEYNNVLDRYEKGDKLEVLNSIGITLSPHEFEHLLSKAEGFESSVKVLLRKVQEQNQDVVFNRDRDDINIQNKITSDIKKVYTKIRDYYPNKYVDNYQDAKGNLVWSHIYPNFAYRQFVDIKENYDDKVSYYSTDGMISELFKESGVFGNKEMVQNELLNYHILSAIKRADRTISDYSDMTDKDFLYIMLSGFNANNYEGSRKGRNTNVAYYNFPIPSDSGSMVMFSGMRYTREDSDLRIEELVKAEQQRVINFKANKSDRKTYRGDKFVLFESLNINDKSTNSEIAEEVKNYIDKEASKLYELYNNEDLPIIISSNSFVDFNLKGTEYKVINNQYFKDNTLISVQEYNSAKLDRRRLTAMELFVSNSILNQASIQILTTKDPANYKHQADYFKRAKGIISPATRMNVNRITDSNGKIKETYKAEYLVDEEGDILKILKEDYGEDSVQYKNFKETLDHIERLHGKGSKAYKQYSKNQNTTDAQGYGDPIRYFDVMRGLVREDRALEDYIKRLESGEEIPYSEDHPPLAVLKPFVQGEYKLGKQVIPYQHKLSTWYLSPKIVGTMGNDKLKGIMEKMGYKFSDTGYSYNSDNRQIDEAIFMSAVKFGPTGVNPGEVYTYKNQDWGLQQETPDHFINNDNKFGVQLAKLIMADLDLDAIFKVPSYINSSGQMTGQQLYDLYHESIASNIRSKLSEINDQVNDKDKIVKLLESEINKRGLGRDYLDAIQKIGDETKLPLWFPTHASLIESIVSSIYRNNVSTIKTPGPNLINATSWGFKDPPKIIWGEDGSIEAMEAYLPAYYKGKVDSGMDLLLYRIPTEDKYSMIKVRVKGFFPKSAGAAVVLPAEITSIAGLDFDIDKVFGYTFNINEDGTKLIEGDEYEINQNKVLDIILSILSHPTTTHSQTNPGGFEQFQDIINNKLGLAETEKLDTISPYSQLKTRANIATGAKNIGIAVNFNNLKALLQYSNVTLGQYIIVGDTRLNDLSVRTDIKGNTISRNLAEFVAQSVDNAKDPIAGKGNVNPTTLNVIGTLLSVGVDMETTLRFVNNPQIKSFIKEYIEGGANAEVKNQLIAKYLNEFNAFTHELTDILNPKEALKNYLAIELMSNSVSKLIQVVRSSDSGIKKTFYDALEKMQAKRELLNSEFHTKNLSGVSEFLNSNTYNKEQFDSGIKEPVNVLQDIFPQLSEGMRSIFNDYIEIQGNLYKEDMQLLFLEYMKFVASEYEFYSKDELLRVRNELPNKFKELRQKDSDYINFLNYLEVQYIDNLPILQLSNSLGMDNHDQANFRRLWAGMLESNNKEYRDFGNDLLKYAFGQGGFGISFGNFSHLQPIDIFSTLTVGDISFKEFMNSKIESLFNEGLIESHKFISQVIPIHFRKLRSVPTIQKNISKSLEDTGKAFLNQSDIPNLKSLDEAPTYVIYDRNRVLRKAFSTEEYVAYSEISSNGIYNRGMKYYTYSPFNEINTQDRNVISDSNNNEDVLNDLVEELPSEIESKIVDNNILSQIQPPSNRHLSKDSDGNEIIYNESLGKYIRKCVD